MAKKPTKRPRKAASVPRKPPPRSVRQEVLGERRLVEIAELYATGFTQWEIAERFGLNQSTISRALDDCRKAWRETYAAQFNERIYTELAKIDALEIEAWRAYRRSCQDQKRSKIRTIDQKKEQAVTMGSRDGEPRYQEMVLKCIDRRLRLLGLDAPQKFAPTTPDGTEPYDQLSTEDLIARRQAIVERLQFVEKATGARAAEARPRAADPIRKK
ncbi:hypothetical protein KIH39_26460 [Telmatocola sphagniphila]|uniref:Uncharacterized protein n=1 Tax=Telmatocola sphagniphila TaxID=1123043 RepID=A0A8E6EY56_9BACT|nr:helix-turn-helix domain-containing protein [Telmatocola sphagniphila]QVL32333.1 hypothetical protein KIH39_26460 [Telmatocola sphagniphila]